MNKNKLDFGISPEKIAGKNVLLATTVWNKELLLPARNEIKEKLESMSVNILELFCPGSLEALKDSLIRTMLMVLLL